MTKTTVNIAIISGLIILSLPLCLCGSGGYVPFGGRQAGMGHMGVALYDFWSVSHNQAGIANIQSTAAGFYFENSYMLRELSFGAGAVALPTQSGVLGLCITYYGFPLYNETKASIAFARAFSEEFSAGLQLSYMHTHIGEGYGSTGNVIAELGFIYELIPKLKLGAHIFNPTRAITGNHHNNRIPSIIRLGFIYVFSEKLLIGIETQKDINLPPSLRTGIEYMITEGIYARAGIGTGPVTNAFGAGFKTGNINIDLASSFHYILGYSPQLSIIYSFY